MPNCTEHHLQHENARSPKRAPHEVRAWSAHFETLPVGDAEDLEWFAAEVRCINPARTDLQTIVDYFDVDDFASFGGAP